MTCSDNQCRTERQRMIQAFRDIEEAISGEQFATPALLDRIERICRESVREKKSGKGGKRNGN